MDILRPEYYFLKIIDITMSQTFCEYIRSLREEHKLPLRKVAAALDIDPSTLSKIERGERAANAEIVDKFATIFSIPRDKLRLMFLSDKVANELWTEINSNEILQVAEEKIEYIRLRKSEQGEIEFKPELK